MTQMLKKEEKVVLALRTLYQQYGYQLYKMNKFEEYDFYAENKKFLTEKSIITFTDTNGKLMALKPDVTLSIVKNIQVQPRCVQKLCYDENVYRAWGSNKEFQEIMQAGLECIGDIDNYAIGEVVLLAAKSLQMIKEPFVLSLSHMGFLHGFLEELNLDVSQQGRMLAALGYKNKKEILALCQEFSISTQLTICIERLSDIYGSITDVIPLLEELSVNQKTEMAWKQLAEIGFLLQENGYEDSIVVDFSLTDNVAYYNGVIFKGFVPGVPNPVLSGGQYDHLMEKLHKKCGAIGFAVYLNLLERLDTEKPVYDVDILLTYEDEITTAAVGKAVKSLIDAGLRVKVEKEPSSYLRYEKLAYVQEDGRVRFAADD